MRRTNVIKAWSEQKSAAGDGLRASGATLYMGDTPIACWLDRADETGAQIALSAPNVRRPWVVANIRDIVDRLHCTLLKVPCPVVSPTPQQHAENMAYLLMEWRKPIITAARNGRYARSHYEGAKQHAREARLYAWAFDLPAPTLNLGHEVLARARRNATTNKRQRPKPAPSRAMIRAQWRAGRGKASVFAGPIMLRLSSDKRRIETSDGEQIAVAHVPAAMIWELACECRKLRKARIWRIVSERPRVGRWTVQAIHADGSLQIACHTLPYDEIARLVLELRQG